MSGERIATIVNQHVPNCGLPPHFESGEYAFLSAFENEHGEQWIAFWEDDELRVRAGELQWDTSRTVNADGTLDGIILSPAERLWLIACTEVCRSFRDRRKGATG